MRVKQVLLSDKLILFICSVPKAQEMGKKLFGYENEKATL